jgi:hypothetical protein
MLLHSRCQRGVAACDRSRTTSTPAVTRFAAAARQAATPQHISTTAAAHKLLQPGAAAPAARNSAGLTTICRAAPQEYSVTAQESLQGAGASACRGDSQARPCGASAAGAAACMMMGWLHTRV